MNQLLQPTALLRIAWEDYKQKAKTLALLMAGFYVVMGVVLMIATGGSLATSYSADDLGAGVIPFVVGMLVVVVLGIFVEIALIYLASGEEKEIKTALKKAQSHFWVFLGLAILLALTILGGLILLIVPGLIFMIWFSLSYFTLLLENKKIVEAMKASKAYVKGRFWPVVGRFLLLWLVMVPFWIITSIVGDESVLGLLVNTLVAVFVGPFAIVYMYHLYKNIKEVAGVHGATTNIPPAS